MSELMSVAEGIAPQSMVFSSPHGVGYQPCESSSDPAADAVIPGFSPTPCILRVDHEVLAHRGCTLTVGFLDNPSKALRTRSCRYECVEQKHYNSSS